MATKKHLRLLSPAESERVLLMTDEAVRFWQDDDLAAVGLVKRYCVSPTWDSACPVTLIWESTGASARFSVGYGTREEWERGALHYVSTEKTSILLTNLYKASEYRWQVTATYADGEALTAEGHFFTEDIGPRVITVDGIANVRDEGGYLCADGTRTRQGRIYRSTCYTRQGLAHGTVELTKQGADTLIRELGIRTEMDIRNAYFEQCPLTRPMRIIRHELYQYTGLLNAPERYIAALRELADPAVYPVIYHCFGGADRTGTLSLCLGAILGYDDKTLIRDYEHTSFSVSGLRDRNLTVETDGGSFGRLLEHFATYSQGSIADGCVCFLREHGLEDAVIHAIRQNMH